ncbi:MAG: ABC transporter substrate-binding protein [Clostridia bacterium]|nr:ABC transporter substrate-binding protein [Clostridia bacterium]
MKLNKRLLTALMAGALSVTMLAGCGGNAAGDAAAQNGGTTGGAATSGTSLSGKTVRVGICQLVQHPALDAATKGFQDKLTELVEADGGKVEFDNQNASGDAATCATIVNGFVSSNVDLILANATAPLQAAASGTDSIPILGTSVTDYATALDISNWTGATGRNISGTSDLAPLDQQADLLHEMFPDAKNVGLLYCSAEPNSAYQISVIKPLLEKMGYTCTEYSFADSNDLASVCTKAADSSDVIYVPTDNTVASNTEIIKNIVVPKKIPVIAGEEGICKGCGVATLSISYEELGQTTGQMAYDILAKGADITKMNVQFAPNVTKKYNKAIGDQLGLTAPEGFETITE